VEKLAGASSSAAVSNEYADEAPRVNGVMSNGIASGMELTPRSAAGDGKGFANCVHRIVKDLLVKVDRLEGILTNLRVSSQHLIRA